MKKRILFVEDEVVLLSMYAAMLEDARDSWEVSTATDSREALQLMARSPFDVVVADVFMPGMDGIELMNEVKIRHPSTSRIILSVLSDQQRVARSLNATHQFIAKPFDVEAFRATLARIRGLDAFLQDERLKLLVGQFGTLPSFPAMYLEIMQSLKSPDASFESTAAIIAKDPAMIAKMLQIVNSVAIGLAHRVGSPFEAVEYLGLGAVRSLVLSAHVFSCFERTEIKGLSIDRLWGHAVGCGMIARMIMRLEEAPAADAEDAYTAGVLHDIGQLMLASNLPGQYQRTLALASERAIPLHEAELEFFGVTHAGVAAYLLGLWGLPATLVEAVAFHHSPGRSDTRTFGPLAAVHAANVLEHELNSGIDGRLAELDLAYLSAVGIQDRLETWRVGAAKLLDSSEKD